MKEKLSRSELKLAINNLSYKNKANATRHSEEIANIIKAYV